jgi:hypothetical protein
VILNVSLYVPSVVLFPVFTQLVVPGAVVLIRHAVDCHFVPLDVVALTVALMVAPGATVTLAPPASVAELMVIAA